MLIALLATASAGEATYGKGFTIEEGDYKLKISSRIQLRTTYESPVDDVTASELYVSIPRARLKLSGDAGPKLGYYFQADFGKGQVALKDMFVDYQLADGVSLVAGQYKKSFSRQQLTSSSSMHFSERAITDKAFGGGRDIGVSLLGEPEDGGLGWALGVFNGTGDKGVFVGSVEDDGSVSGKFSNVPTWMAPLAVARVSYDSKGFKSTKESDLKGGDLRWSVGAGAQSLFDVDGGDDGSVRANLDAIVKAHGLSMTGAVYVATAQGGEAWTDQGYSALGFHAQAGYVVGGKVEPVLRYAQVMPDGEDATQEIGGGLNVFSERGHDSKLQASGVYQTTAGEGEIFATAQYQFQF